MNRERVIRLAPTMKKLHAFGHDTSHLEVICFVVFWTAVIIQILLILGVEALLRLINN